MSAEGVYIRRHVPELDGVDPAQVHDPPSQIRRARGYPRPVIDHTAAAAAWRQRRYT